MPAVPHSYIPHIATSPDVERRPRRVDATHGDALPLSPLTSNAGSRPASSLRTWLGSLGEKVAEGLRDFFGPVEFTEIGQAEMHRIAQERFTAKVEAARIERARTMRAGWYCAHCDTRHVLTYRCPLATDGVCANCNTLQPLTKQGRCSCGSSSITNRSLRFQGTRK